MAKKRNETCSITSCCRDNTSKEPHKLQTEATQTQNITILLDNGTIPLHFRRLVLVDTLGEKVGDGSRVLVSLFAYGASCICFHHGISLPY